MDGRRRNREPIASGIDVSVFDESGENQVAILRRCQWYDEVDEIQSVTVTGRGPWQFICAGHFFSGSFEPLPGWNPMAMQFTFSFEHAGRTHSGSAIVRVRGNQGLLQAQGAIDGNVDRYSHRI